MNHNHLPTFPEPTHLSSSEREEQLKYQQYHHNIHYMHQYDPLDIQQQSRPQSRGPAPRPISPVTKYPPMLVQSPQPPSYSQTNLSNRYTIQQQQDIPSPRHSLSNRDSMYSFITISEKDHPTDLKFQFQDVPLDAKSRRLNRNDMDEDDIDFEALDWSSPIDSRNPKNWSSIKKWYVTLVTGYLCLVVSFGCSLYAAGCLKLMFHFGISQEKALLGLTLYLIGLSLAPVLGAPLSEKFGRKLIYVLMLPASMLFMMGTVLAKNITTILVCRFFTGLFGSPVLAIAAGTIADLWDLDMLVVAMTVFSLAPLMGPIMGPIIGGYAAQNFNTPWEEIFYIQLIFAGVAVPFVLLMPETYKPIILKNIAKKELKERKKKNRKLNNQMNNSNFGNNDINLSSSRSYFDKTPKSILSSLKYSRSSKNELPMSSLDSNQAELRADLAPRQHKQTAHDTVRSWLYSVKRSLTATLFFPILLLIQEPIILISSIYASFIFSILFSFLESYTYIFTQTYNFTFGQTGLTFLGIGAGMLLAAAFFILVDRLYLQKLFKEFNQDQLETKSQFENNNNNNSNINSSRSSMMINSIDEKKRSEIVSVISLHGSSDCEDYPHAAASSSKNTNPNGYDMPLENPEQVLIIAKIGSFLLPLSLFWQGWSAHYKLHWLIPVCAGIPFGISLMFIFFSLIIYFEVSYDNNPDLLASVFAANNLLRYLLASGFPLFTLKMYQNLGVHWSSTLFGCISLALVPVPFILDKCGPALRTNSKYANKPINDSRLSGGSKEDGKEEDDDEDDDKENARIAMKLQSPISSNEESEEEHSSDYYKKSTSKK